MSQPAVYDIWAGSLWHLGPRQCAKNVLYLAAMYREYTLLCTSCHMDVVYALCENNMDQYSREVRSKETSHWNVKVVGVTEPALLWRHNGHSGVSNRHPHDCLLNRLFRRRWKKTSKLRVTGLCVGNSPVTGEFPAQMASNAENVSIWWRHHLLLPHTCICHCPKHARICHHTTMHLALLRTCMCNYLIHMKFKVGTEALPHSILDGLGWIGCSLLGPRWRTSSA